MPLGDPISERQSREVVMRKTHMAQSKAEQGSANCVRWTSVLGGGRGGCTYRAEPYGVGVDTSAD